MSRVMLRKAMIMAAGVGSRLGLLSGIVPKPLVPLANIPAMDILINHIMCFGIKDIIANTYFKSEQIIEHYKNFSKELNINFIKEQELSGTAGGLKKCEYFFDSEQDFIVMSGDGLTDININEAFEAHKKSNAVATIVTKGVADSDISKYGIIVSDKNGYVKSFQEKPQLNEAKSNLANTGIYIFKNEIFRHIPENTFFDFAKNVFPELMNSSLKINTYEHKGYWSDIGSIEQYKQSNSDIIENKISSVKLEVIHTQQGKYISGKNLIKSPDCILEGNNIIGNNCTIGKNSIIKNSVLWDNIEIKDNIRIENSIILPNACIKESITNDIITEQTDSEKGNIKTQ